ncbi:MAG: two-component system, chemotaxis family, sensor histidine kinase and response regulator WspE [Thermodesulfobacteriota bacterium]|nr:two-component system, chemotaxis family, sensor histidine kinase and response regulator WspE [Thermodesulfobacteriota bacterium]
MENIDPMMLDLFRIELENNSRVLEAGLVGAEADPAPEKMEPLIRAAHSIKGAARIVGLPAAVTLAHAMEDILAAAQHDKIRLASGHVDLLLKGNDIFKDLSQIETAFIPQGFHDRRQPIEDLAQALRNSLTAGFPPPGEVPKTLPAIQEVAPEPVAAPLAIPEPAPATREGGNETSSPVGAVAETTETVIRQKRAGEQQRTETVLVRVMSENMDRLMGLAGELLVQAQSAGSFNRSLLKMKNSVRVIHDEWERMLLRRSRTAVAGEEDGGVVRAFGALIEEMGDAVATQMVDYERYSRRLEHLAHRLYGETVGSRMVPFSEGLHGLSRMVRDLAQELGKKVRFRILGETTPVDRDILEKIEAPLSHLLRNAVDHGLETPEERRAIGKAQEGIITLEARHVAGMLNISVSDDGRGMDPEGIRIKIVQKGLVKEEMAAALTRSELYEFLFLPGFSTSHKVTEISGRGVGLDVVFSMTQEVGGLVRVDSEKDRRTVFVLQLPLTLSVLRTLIVEVAGEPYALPLSRIDRLLRVSRDDLQVLEDRQFCASDGEHVGIVTCRQLFQFPPAEEAGRVIHVVVISDRLNRYGLVVDSFRGEETVVVRPLDSRLGKAPNIHAAAVLQDGSPVLILDADDLVRSIHQLLGQGKPGKIGAGERSALTEKKRILVVDDSLTVREVERKLLEKEGYHVTVAVDGMVGWNSLQQESFDLLISDVDMPRMNGIELVRKIKDHNRLRSLPVMIVSYKDSEEDRLRGLDAGANYYLTKGSFHDETLLVAVKDLIGNP